MQTSTAAGGIPGTTVTGDGTLVWLASYPKSGNTWTRLFLSRFLADDDAPVDLDAIGLLGSISSNRSAFDEVIGLPSSDLTDDEVDQLRPAVYRAWGEAVDHPLFVKVHDANHPTAAGPLFPPHLTRAAVHLVRNPLDVVVSLAFHEGHGDYDRTVGKLNRPDRVIAGNRRTQLRQILLDWSGHTRSWCEESAFPVATFRYESLVADPAGEFGRMVTFLGLEGADDPARIGRAVDATRFELLRDVEVERGFRERIHDRARFFRSGRPGDWRRELTPTQVSAIVDAHGEVMRAFGYLDDAGVPC